MVLNLIQVLVSHPLGDKEGFTINLTIRADGVKLPAEVIIKTAAKGGVLSEAYLAKLIIPDNIIVKSARKSWWNGVFDNGYIETVFQGNQDHTVLLRDSFAVHMTAESVELLESKNVHQIIIPPGMTGKWQPLDVSVNKAFKDYFREQYKRWRTENIKFTHKGNIKKPGKQEFINMVSVAWDKISEEVVRNSFYAAEILRKPQISVGETFEEDDNLLEVSFFSVTSFFGLEDNSNDSDGFGSGDEDGAA